MRAYSAAARKAKLDQLGVAEAARWAWSDLDIKRALAKSPAQKEREARASARDGWDRLIATTQDLHHCDLVTACLSWLDPADLEALARLGIGGFGERIG